MSVDSRFVGRSGEKRFSALCSDNGVTCNPAQEDDYGWDHVIQFPHEGLRGVPADLQRSLPPVFVQTKVHKSSHGSVRMKLSNALSLARSPNPCFVVVPPNDVDGLWRAIHFWESQIEHTLKRARKAAREGIPENLFHKKWISFQLTETDKRNAEELLPWMKNSVRDTGADYASVKCSLINSVGFDDSQFVGTIEFTSPSTVEDLIDHQLGLTPTIPIGKFELRNRRFGIEIAMPMPVPSEGEWTGRLHSNARACSVQLRGPDNTELRLDGELFVGSLPGLPIEQCKFRVKADFLDMVQSMSGESKLVTRFNASEKRTPAQLESLARVMSWAGLGPIDLQVWSDDKRLFGGTATLDPFAERAAFEALTMLIGPLAQLSSHLRLSYPQISIGDIQAAEDELIALHGFLTAPDMKVEAKLTLQARPEEVASVVTYAFADVAGWRFGALAKWKCSGRINDAGMWELKLRDRRVVERYAFESTDSSAAATFDADARRIAAAPHTLFMDENAVARLVRPVN